MPVLVPTQPPLQGAWGWPDMKQTIMSIYCSAEVECVWSWSSTPLNACMARIGTTLQIPDVSTIFICLFFWGREGDGVTSLTAFGVLEHVTKAMFVSQRYKV
jgi:hypothetical protein